MDILFLPGLLCTCDIFSYQMAHLPKGFHGIPVSPGCYPTMREIATAIIRRVERPVILCGLSMGGIVAMEILRKAPDLVEGMILLDTNALNEAEEVSKRRYVLVERAEEIGPGKMSLERLLPVLVHDTGNDGYRKMIYKMAEAVGIEKLRCHADALSSRIDYSSVLKAQQKKTIIIFGEYDRLTPKQRHEHLKDLLPDAVLDEVPDCGHLSTIERPTAVSVAINSWLRKEFCS